MTGGELLRDARTRHGLTQRQLAARARTSQAAISRIERGVVSPTVDTLAELFWLMNEELVLQAVPLDWGFDIDILRSNLTVSPGERLQQSVERAGRTSHMRGCAVHPSALARRTPTRGAPVAEVRTGDLLLTPLIDKQ